MKVTSSEPVKVLLIGKADRAEIQPIVEWLIQRVASSGERLAVNTVLSIPASLQLSFFPDLIVVLQSEPDEYSTSEIQSLFACAPLARVVVVCGEWCESIARNRQSWPFAVLARATEAINRMERECELLLSPENYGSIPLSASREEVFEFDRGTVHPNAANTPHQTKTKADSPVQINIVSPDASFRAFVGETFEAAGLMYQSFDSISSLLDHHSQRQNGMHSRESGEIFQNVILTPASVDAEPQFSLNLIDVDPSSESRLNSISQFISSSHASRTMALSNQPTSHVTSQLLQAGVDGVLAKSTLSINLLETISGMVAGLLKEPTNQRSRN